MSVQTINVKFVCSHMPTSSLFGISQSHRLPSLDEHWGTCDHGSDCLIARAVRHRQPERCLCLRFLSMY